MEKEGEVAKQGPRKKKDYKEPPPAPFFNVQELKRSSFYKALIAEFVGSLLFLCIITLASIGYMGMSDPAKTLRRCNGVGFVGIAWACGGTVFVLVFCTSNISGGHINPATTFALLLARKVSLIRAVSYMVVQCLGCICGAGLAKGFQTAHFDRYGGVVNIVKPGYTKGGALGAEIIGTFVLVYTIFSATDPKRRVRDSHIPALPPLPSGIAILLVHLALIPIDGTSINPARSLGSAVIYNNSKVWHEQWIFWVGPFIGAGIAALYHQSVLRAGAYKVIGSLCSPSDVVVPEMDFRPPPRPAGNAHISLSNRFQNKVGVGPTSPPTILHNPLGVAPTFL